MGKGGGNGRYLAADFIEAIPGSGGIITTIARRVGCSWHTAQKYIRQYATVQAAYDDECEGVTDLAESVVIKAIRDDDVASAKWWLTKKGKDRGFVERQEVDVRIDDVDAAIERELARVADSRQAADAGAAEGAERGE